MLEQIKQYINKLYDDYSIKLLHIAGITLNKEYSHFQLLCPNNTILKDTGYRIVQQTSPIGNKDEIILYQGNEIVAGYEFNIDIQDNNIKISVEKF